MSLKQGEDEVEASFIAKLSNVLFPFPSTYSSVTLGLKKKLTQLVLEKCQVLHFGGRVWNN